MTYDNPPVMLPAQCRAARALLNMDQVTLAELAEVSRNTVADFESEKRTPRIQSVAAMQKALEAAGAVMVPENGNGPGARLRFEWARAHQRDNGEWVVFARWNKGDRLEGVAIEVALLAAIRAEMKGQVDLAKALTSAAESALSNTPARIAETVRRLSVTQAAMERERNANPFGIDGDAMAQLTALEQSDLEGLAALRAAEYGR